MHEYLEYNGHRIGGVFTITIYCALCGKHHTINERDLTTDEFAKALSIFLSAITFIGVDNNA